MQSFSSSSICEITCFYKDQKSDVKHLRALLYNVILSIRLSFRKFFLVPRSWSFSWCWSGKRWIAEICRVVITMMTGSLTSLLVNNQCQEEEKRIVANARWVVHLVWGTMTMNKAISSPYRSQVWRSSCRLAGIWKVMTNNCCIMRLSAKDLHNSERLT